MSKINVLNQKQSIKKKSILIHYIFLITVNYCKRTFK